MTDHEAMTTQLEIRHHTRYDYSAPVTLAHHLAHLQPLVDEHQQLKAFELLIGPGADHRREAADAHGNAACWFSISQAHEQLDVQTRAVVQLQPRFDALDTSASPAWDALAASLRYVPRHDFDPALEYALPSPFIPRLSELHTYAASSLPPGRPVAEAAIELMQRIHDEFVYEAASTQVDTPLAQAFEQKRGVCQDFAHILAGALRMHGVPVRYVSGYLLTSAGDDEPRLLGADASHAWVQVWCPRTPGVPDSASGAWLDLDPTNRVIPREGHVRVAVGRDFGDVTPLRGVIRGGGRHTLAVGVATRKLN